MIAIETGSGGWESCPTPMTDQRDNRTGHIDNTRQWETYCKTTWPILQDNRTDNRIDTTRHRTHTTRPQDTYYKTTGQILQDHMRHTTTQQRDTYYKTTGHILQHNKTHTTRQHGTYYKTTGQRTHTTRQRDTYYKTAGHIQQEIAASCFIIKLTD